MKSKSKKKVKAAKKAKKPAQPKQAQTRSKAARAHIAEGNTAIHTRRTPNQGSVRQGVRTERAEDDLGAASQGGC
jgi:hypothetical protein